MKQFLRAIGLARQNPQDFLIARLTTTELSLLEAYEMAEEWAARVSLLEGRRTRLQDQLNDYEGEVP